MTDGALFMVMILAGAAMGLILLLGGRKPSRRAGGLSKAAPTFDSADLLELTARFDAVDKQHRRGQVRQAEELYRRLDLLVNRRAPVRGIALGRDPEPTQIRFADGTLLLGLGNRADLTTLAEAARRSAMWLSTYRAVPQGWQLIFESRTGRVSAVLREVKI